MNTKTAPATQPAHPIFLKLKKIVLPRLEMYTEDLTKHDFNILQTYKGAFLYAFRKTGTVLIKLENDFKNYLTRIDQTIHTPEDLKNFIKNEIIWIIHEMNSDFLFYDGKKLNHITREQAKRIHAAHVEQVIYKYERETQNTI
jgi:hypothetical protein